MANVVLTLKVGNLRVHPQNNNNYTASHGKILHVIFKDDNQKNIIDVSEYKAMGFDNCHERSIDRFKYTLKNYQTSTFAIHRTEIFKRVMSYIDEKKIELNNRTLNPDIIFNNELLPNFLSCCLGRNKFIDKLYMIRTSILTDSKVNYSTQKSIHNYFISDKGKEIIDKYNNIIAKEVTLIDQNSFDENLKIVEKEISLFIKKNYIKKLKFFKITVIKFIKNLLKYLKLFNYVKKIKNKKYTFNPLDDSRYKNSYKKFLDLVVY